MNRQQASHYAKETMDIIKKGHYTLPNKKEVTLTKEINSSILLALLYRPEELDELLKQKGERGNEKTVIEVTGETTLEASDRLLKEGYTNVACLNFASAKYPGGGFLKGSRAQEESLARSSALYPTIEQMTEMYEHNKQLRTGFYSDYMVFSPNVPVFRHDKGHLLQKPYLVSMITAPAVNAGVVTEREKNHIQEIEPIMLKRIQKILAIAKAQKQEAVVLGAFGCGVFKNDSLVVAELFKEALEDERFKNQFQKIVFAVYEGKQVGYSQLMFNGVFNPISTK
jgi:uncharacterized protein (TIGR02452 family)